MNEMPDRKMIGVDPYANERLLESPFHPRQAPLNLREAWSAWNGYRFAEYYYDSVYEYFCVRNACATYDISPMQKYIISGGDSEAMLNRMVTRDVSKQKENRVSYVVWCNDEGRMVDDGTIFKLASDRFMLTCGSSCIAWLKMSAFGFADVTIEDVSDQTAALSFQGPTTCAVLKKMGLQGIETAKPFDIRHFPFATGTLMVSRTGFTGDLATNYGSNLRWRLNCGIGCMRSALITAFSPLAKQPPIWRVLKPVSSCPTWNSMRR